MIVRKTTITHPDGTVEVREDYHQRPWYDYTGPIWIAPYPTRWDRPYYSPTVIHSNETLGQGAWS